MKNIYKMKKLLSNNYIVLYITLISHLIIGYTCIIKPKEIPMNMIQLIGIIFILRAIEYIIDIYFKNNEYEK